MPIVQAGRQSTRHHQHQHHHHHQRGQAMNTDLEVMTPDNPRWREFKEKLWACFETFGCDHTFDLTKLVLARMAGVNIEASLKYFEDHGGYCDCEIGLNVRDEDEVRALQQWFALREQAALSIDPETAEVNWTYGIMGDPYSLGHLPEHARNTGRQYWARAPGCDIWVAFDDLPEKTYNALKRKLDE
jgi:hypothetical protein